MLRLGVVVLSKFNASLLIMKRSQTVWNWLCGLYFLLLLSIVVIADLGLIPYDLFQEMQNYDIYGHFILYGIASVLVHQAFRRQRIHLFNLSLPLGPFLFGLITFVEEYSQQFFPMRTYSVVDLAASLIGILLFYEITEIYYYLKTKPS